MSDMVKTETVGRLAFEQMPNEPSRAYAALKVYLELGPARTLGEVAAKIGKGKRSVQRWSARYGWQERAQAYVAHMAELERKAIESLATDKAVEWWKVHEPLKREAWQEAVATIALVRKKRDAWMASKRLPELGALARLLDLAFKLKQFAAGMPSEVKEVHQHVTGRIDMEWEAAIRKAYGAKKAADGPVVEVEEVAKIEILDSKSEGSSKTENRSAERGEKDEG